LLNGTLLPALVRIGAPLLVIQDPATAHGPTLGLHAVTSGHEAPARGRRPAGPTHAGHADRDAPRARGPGGAAVRGTARGARGRASAAGTRRYLVIDVAPLTPALRSFAPLLRQARSLGCTLIVTCQSPGSLEPGLPALFTSHVAFYHFYKRCLRVMAEDVLAATGAAETNTVGQADAAQPLRPAAGDRSAGWSAGSAGSRSASASSSPPARPTNRCGPDAGHFAKVGDLNG
jgi:hypothetical protein